MKRLFIKSLAISQLLLSYGLNAAPPQEAAEATIEGEFLIVHIDYKKGKSEFAYHVKDRNTGEIVELKFERKPPHGLHSGDKVTVHGKKLNRELWVQDVSGPQAETDESAAAAGADVAGAAVQRKALYMVVNFNNASNPAYFSSADVATAANRIFYDAYSVDKVYQEGSFGNLAFPPPEQGGGKAIGPLSITGPAACDYYGIASLADAAATAAGENVSLYNRKIYLIPPYPVSPCNWLALGQVGSYGSAGTRLAWTTSNDANALIHELGHNEGWHHAGLDADNNEVLDAGTGGEYGDTSDAMGYCCSKRKFNAVHLDQIGWLPAAKVVTAINSGIYHLEPLGNYPDSACVAPDGVSACPQLLRIQKDAGAYAYNLSYRQVKGLDQALSSTYTGGVNIHNGKKADIWSYHVKSLGDGGTFSDSVNGISVTQISHDPSKVVVQVDLTPLPPPADPSGLTASAASSSAVDLSWTDNSDNETGFKIERSPDGMSSWVLAGQVGPNTVVYRNTGLVSGTTYFYRVFAYNGSGNSVNSTNIASAVTEAVLPPAAPSLLSATALKGKKIKLQWTDNANNETSFVVQRSTNGTSWSTLATLAANTVTYTNSGLAAGTTYSYRVWASNSGGNSSYASVSATATK